MRFNSRGDWTGGVGGGDSERPVTAVCNGRVIDPGPGGAGDWLNDDEFIVNRAGYTQLHAVNKDSGTHRVLHTETRGLIGSAAAGGGRFAYRVDGVGYFRDSGEPCLPVVGMGRDGALATQGHPFNGTGLVVNGRVLSGGLCWSVHVLDADHVAWREADGPHAIGMPTPRVLPGRESYELRVAFDGARWWVIYQASDFNGSLVLHPFDSFDGYVLTTPGANAYRPDLIAIGGVLHTLWATVESEQLGQIAGPFVPQHEFQMRNLLATKPAPAPPPVIPIPPPVTPKLEPHPMPPINGLSFVREIRAKYPTPLGARHWEFLVEVAQALGAQLFRKESGDRILIPALGVSVNQNVIGRGRLGNWWVDILGDAENTAVPTWDATEGADGEYVDVSGVALPGVLVPPVVVPPVVVPSVSRGPGAQLDAELTALLTRLVAAENRVVAAETRIAKLEALSKSVPSPTSLTGQRISLRTFTGHYLCAENGGGGEVNATREAAGGWETFTVEQQ